LQLEAFESFIVNRTYVGIVKVKLEVGGKKYLVEMATKMDFWSEEAGTTIIRTGVGMGEDRLVPPIQHGKAESKDCTALLGRGL
jgi:hypothetical protein